MKRSIWTRIIAFVLIFSLLPVNASAASIGSSSNSKWSWNWDWLRDLIPDFGSNEPVEETEPVETEAPTETADPATDGNTNLVLVEDESTVENGEMLRASTYMLTNTASEPADNAGIALMSTEDVAATAEEGTVLKYFGVTMYDYDTTTINNATHLADIEAGLGDEWQGLYFSGGEPSAESFAYSTGNKITVDEGYLLVVPEFDSNGYITNLDTSKEYVFVNKRGSQAIYDNNSSSSTSFKRTAVSTAGNSVINKTSNVTEWTLTANGDGYRVKSDRSSTSSYYMVIGNGTGYSRIYNSSNSIPTTYIMSYPGDANCVVLNQGGYYMNHYSGDSGSTFAGYTERSDPGAAFYIYEVVENVEVDEMISTGSLAYAAWNHWDKDITSNTGNTGGQKIYTGLVASQLDANKDIVFNVPDGGIFNSDATVKNIYTNVQIPFVYVNGVYTFDASVNGVYFFEDENQGSSGTAASNTRLYFNEGNTQSNGGSYGDGSSTVWAPFNSSTSFTEANMNYHFGIRTTIPFTMTTNGRMNQSDDTSDAITFSFSGDDDVWVFIDGKLVIDLGGIHNRLDAEINFATNTVTYSVSNAKAEEYETGSFNDSTFTLTQTLFENLIPQDRATFAAADTHELTIFYLERGKGSSNCKIQFNLPMKDTVTVTKHATQSYEADTDTVSNLTAAEQAIVNNIDFGFTLYKSTDGGTTFARVANTNFNLVNENGQVLEVRSTDANGHFYLKNGQSARFVTAFTNEDGNGVTYYVVEDDVSALGFVTPDYNFDGTAANGFAANGSSYTKGNLIPEQVLATDATENKSYAVTVYGSDESEDSVVFICENYIDAKLPNPSALPADDKIVIDYGLGVDINVLVNDNFRGDTIEVIGVYGDNVTLRATSTQDNELTIDQVIDNPDSAPKFGTATVNADNTLTYQLTEQLTGVEVLTYVIQVTGSVTDGANTTRTAYAYGIAKVYIIPATTMYYEEDFSTMITYTGSYWQADPVVESAYTNAKQEPGVVGTIGDSPYGSDAAYINDSHDSNGTSRYATTGTSAVKFSYSFTGTATSFFARTSNNSGFMKIVITDADGNTVHSSYRNTIYQTEDGSSVTLYNIPVFTYVADSYGTYTVTVTVLRGTTTNRYGTDFWLDGVRVYAPLDPNDTNYGIATSAYATDGEANMANVTLREKILTESDFEVDENGELVVDDLGNPIPVWKDGGNFVLFTDTDGAMDTAEEYESFGPKEEVYLNNGQSVTFSLYDWDPNSNRIYLGIKAPKGSGTVTIGSTTLTINNAADCYYDISSYGTITTDDDGIKTITFTIIAGADSLISLTNIKVSGNFEFTIITPTDEEADNLEAYSDEQNEEEPIDEETEEEVIEEEVTNEENGDETAGETNEDVPADETNDQTQEG